MDFATFATGTETRLSNMPTVQYLACANDWGSVGEISRCILSTYPLPPDQIHSACMQNPKCIGFRIKNDRSSGDILGQNIDSPGWLKPNF
jgi:hypothetical protein